MGGLAQTQPLYVWCTRQCRIRPCCVRAHMYAVRYALTPLCNPFCFIVIICYLPPPSSTCYSLREFRTDMDVFDASSAECAKTKNRILKNVRKEKNNKDVTRCSHYSFYRTTSQPAHPVNVVLSSIFTPSIVEHACATVS